MDRLGFSLQGKMEILKLGSEYNVNIFTNSFLNKVNRYFTLTVTVDTTTKCFCLMLRCLVDQIRLSLSNVYTGFGFLKVFRPPS